MAFPSFKILQWLPWHLGWNQMSSPDPLFHLEPYLSLTPSFCPVHSGRQMYPMFFPTAGTLHILFSVLGLLLAFPIIFKKVPFHKHISTASYTTFNPHHICNSLFKSVSMMIRLIVVIRILIINTFLIIRHNCSLPQVLYIQRCSRSDLYQLMRVHC